MPGNAIEMTIGGRTVRTLKDLLPTEPGLRALFVAKTPAPISVATGHYFQGSQGRAFWKRLKEYGLLNQATEFEDDSLHSHGFGLTDIVKEPRDFGSEPGDQEYRDGIDRILQLIESHQPRVTVFVYKGVLDKILRLRFGIREKGIYGFNHELTPLFGSLVFAFPLPGVGPCTREQAATVMRELATVLHD